MFTVLAWDDVDLRTVVWGQYHFFETALMVIGHLEENEVECWLANFGQQKR